MTYELNITNDAENDLRRAYRWYQMESKLDDIASRWYDGFLNKMESLKDFPESCSLAHESVIFRMTFANSSTDQENAKHTAPYSESLRTPSKSSPSVTSCNAT